MARAARVVAEHIPHHIVQRGNRNQRVFFQDSDKSEYLRLLREQSQRYAVQIWAYCLMDTHVHLVAVPSQGDGLAKCLAQTHKRYTRMINFRHEWRGYLWQGRFASYPMDEQYLFAAIRYIERNPVTAGMVHVAEEYPWSSANAHVLRVADPVLSPCHLEERIPDWREYLRSADRQTMQQIEAHLRTGRPLAEPTFIRRLEEQLGRLLARGKPGPKREAQGSSTGPLADESQIIQLPQVAAN